MSDESPVTTDAGISPTFLANTASKDVETAKMMLGIIIDKLPTVTDAQERAQALRECKLVLETVAAAHLNKPDKDKPLSDLWVNASSVYAEVNAPKTT